MLLSGYILSTIGHYLHLQIPASEMDALPDAGLDMLKACYSKCVHNNRQLLPTSFAAALPPAGTNPARSLRSGLVLDGQHRILLRTDRPACDILTFTTEQLPARSVSQGPTATRLQCLHHYAAA
jgi:hypothetical protein